METQHQKLAFSLLVTSLLLIPSAASAQTLIVVQPDSQTTSVRLSDLHGGNPDLVRGPTDIKRLKTGSDNTGGPAQPDGALQTTLGPLINATPGTHFDGMSVYEGGYIPSDNNIAVGPNHVVETVNAAVSVYTKGGTRLMGPTALRSMWTGLGGNCAANNGGDPIVQYDKAADRWMITQLGSLSNPYSECIAVSQTNDPTGAYNLYSYAFGSNLNDYPKFGVWPTATNSAYLATYNLFANGASFAGPEICAYDRQAMLAGAAATALCYTGIGGASFLPADLDGATPPVDGTPGYFLALNGSTSLRMYKLAPNFAAATATLTAMPNLTVTSYSQSGSVPQPGTTMQLDSLSDRAMYRLAFRMFGDHETMVMAHSVVAGTSSGVRWYEIRSSAVSTNPTFSVFQQGTFAPDSNYRWMGSAAMDQSGDIAIGYSAGSSTLFPSVRYTGRTPGDAAGTMESEASIKEGAGSQTGYSRWGDYSSMRIDPSDDCTFWYANEYLPVTSSYGWYTHIGSFKFSGCGGAPAPDFSLSASPTAMTVTQGGAAGTSTVTVTSLNGFNSVVNLAVTGCPTGATCTVSPISVTPTSTATLSVTPGSAAAGTSNVTVSGTGSTGVRSTSVSVTVQPPPDFSLSASPSSVSAAQGQVKTSTITVGSIGGFSSPVGLTVDVCPNNATCTFSPTSVTPSANGSATSTFTVATTGTTPTGSYTLTIKGNGLHPITVSLTVTAAADFNIATPASITATRRTSASEQVSVTAVGASSSVTLSISGLPAKVTASFAPNPVTTTATSTSTLTLSANPQAIRGTYSLTITGTNGPNTHSTTPFTLTIN